MLDMKTPFALPPLLLSHLVMPNPNEIISLSPAQLVQIQFKIFHSTEAGRERGRGGGPPAEAIEVALQLRKEAKEEEGDGEGGE